MDKAKEVFIKSIEEAEEKGLIAPDAAMLQKALVEKHLGETNGRENGS